MLHVLAHVDAGSLAASCHDTGWIRHAGAQLGSAEERALGDDARLLAQILSTHDALAAVHALAWIFDSDAQVTAATTRDLAELDERDVADAGALAVALSAGPAVELLRAAAELELPLLRSMPMHAGDRERERRALADELIGITSAAPGLAHASVALARPLPRRGRAWRASILVGAPGIAGAEASHLAWQAAHEATVLEIVRAASDDAASHPVRRRAHEHPSSFEAVERFALGLLRSRARRVGLAEAHGQWLATLDVRALGPIPDVDDPTE